MSNDSQLNVIIEGRDNLSPQLSQLESKLIRFVGAVSSAMSAIKVISFPIQAVRTFEREMANVQKTTNFTNGQIRVLGDSILDLSRKINLSAEDLAKIASAAGQQGLGREGVAGVEKFTASVARMAAVLDVSAQDAGMSIGKITSIFKIGLTDVERVVSAFNQVSNNSTATGEQLLDVVKRIGDAAGSLNLEQSLGVASTAIDFGVSPEVAGTSLSKIFSEFYARADSFSKLLGVSVTDWMAQLQSNGITALKMYLTRLRTLSADEQQRNIKELSGGGRISALMTKLLNDTGNEVLDKNLENSSQGYTQATSALKEQTTVLRTLDAQVQMATNSFQVLGIKAGEVFSPKLAAYVADLNKALSDPAVIKFAEAVGLAFLDIFDTISQVVQAVASLKINFENIIPLIKGLLAIKLGQIVTASAISNVRGATTALGEMKQAMRGVAVDGAAGTTGNLAGAIGGIKTLIAQQRELAAATQQRGAIQAEVSARSIALEQAEAEAVAAGNAMRVAAESRTTAGGAIMAARNAMIAAEVAGQQRLATVQSEYHNRRTASEAAATGRLALIEAEFQGKRAGAAALGSRKLLNAAKAERDAQLADEATFQTRSLRGLDSYYTRAIARAQAAAAEQLAIAKAQQAAALSSFDGVVAGQGNPKLQERNSSAAAGVVVAAGALGESKAALAANEARLAATASAASRFGTAMTVLGRVINGTIQVLGKAFFWFGLIYTALDMFGLLDNLGATFDKITDALGFTSEASRKEAQNQRDAAEAWRVSNQERLNAVEAMNKYVDAQGRISGATVETLKANLTDPDARTRSEAKSQFLTLAQGTASQQELGVSKLELFKLDKAGLEKELAEGKAMVEAARADVAAKQAAADRAGNGKTRFGGTLEAASLEESKRNLKTLEEAVATTDTKLATFSTRVLQGIDQLSSAGAANAEKLKALTPGLFTEQSANAFKEVAGEVISLNAQLEIAKKRTEEANAARLSLNNGGTSDQIAAAEEELKSATEAQGRINVALAAISGDMDKFIVDAKQKNLGDAVIGSLEFLPELLKRPSADLQNFVNILNQLSTAGATLSGNLTVPKAAGSGSDSFTPQTDSEMRRLSRARIDLAKAELQALANLEKEGNKQRQDELEFSYSRSLTSIKGYYAARLTIARSNIDIEIKLKQAELSAIQSEMDTVATDADKAARKARDALASATPDNRAKLQDESNVADAKGNSEQIKMQAQVVAAQGAIDLLMVQKKALDDSVGREQDNALREFGDSVANQREALVQFFGAGTDQEAYSSALEAANLKYRDFLDKLRANAADMPELLPLVDALEVTKQFEAVDAMFENIRAQADLTGRAFTNMSDLISAAVDSGGLTRLEGNVAMQKLREETIKAKEADILRMRTALEVTPVVVGGIEDQSDKYKSLVQDIRDAQVEVAKLKMKGDEVAKSINDGIKGAFENLFNAIATAETDDLVENFVRSVVGSVAQQASAGLADVIMGSLGSSGSGGIGGFFSSLFAPDAPAGGDLTGKGTELNPMVVKVSGTGGLGGLVGSPDGKGNSSGGGMFGGLFDGLFGGSDPTKDPGMSAGGSTGTGFLGDIFGGGDKAGAAAGDGTGAITEAIGGMSESLGSIFDGGLGDLSGTFEGGVGDLGTGLTNLGGSLIGTLQSGTEGIISFIVQIGTSVIGAIMASGAAKSIGSFGAAHTGGIIGLTPTKRSVSASVFANAMRYHTGGRVGLTPDEVPIIAKKGEEMLTKQDPRHRDNGGLDGTAGAGGGTGQGLKVVLVDDQRRVGEFMSSSEGDRVLVDSVKRNADVIRSLVGGKQ